MFFLFANGTWDFANMFITKKHGFSQQGCHKKSGSIGLFLQVRDITVMLSNRLPFVHL
jgi:hypothetical protein